MNRNLFYAIFAELCEEQGWNNDTSVHVLLDYIYNQQDNKTFIDYLREVQNNENGL